MTARTFLTNAQLPPHLREVCNFLARGLVRLRSRDAEDHAREGAIARGPGEVRLHFTAQRSGHAEPNRKGLA